MSVHPVAPGHQLATDVKDKDQVQQIDRVESSVQNEIIKPSYLNVDEFGAHNKVDPKEIERPVHSEDTESSKYATA